MNTKTQLDNFKLKQSISFAKIHPPNNQLINHFVSSIQKAGFSGEVIKTRGGCSSWAADNSIYWIAPNLVLQPIHEMDIKTILRVANQSIFNQLCFTTRGGSTSTNAQSLNYSVMIDTFKHLNKMISHNLNQDDEKEKFIKVQSGISAIEVNQFLKPFGYKFPIEISTSNRATIGGMIATNAAGRGSLIYGNTSNQLLSVSGFLANSQSYEFKKITINQAKEIIKNQKPNWKIYQNLLLNQKYILDTCQKNYPKLMRSHIAYNLPEIFADDTIDLSKLIAGNEGTLALITRAKLRLTPINSHKRLIVIKYGHFFDALNDAKDLISFKPHSIETMDSAITRASEKLPEFGELSQYLTLNGKSCITNFVGLETNYESKLDIQSKKTIAFLKSKSLDFEIIDSLEISEKLYKLREKSAAFFSSPIKVKNETKTPCPFIEDAIVPVENLTDFVRDLYQLFNQYDLSFGIFGHVDVGVLHLRPALNLRNTKDKALIRKLSNQMVELLKRYNGVLWGEHGKGVRAEFTEKLLGYDAIQIISQIKQIFDPDEKLNPHKVASNKKDLYRIDSLPYKSNLLNIANPNGGVWDNVLTCNGNGLCNSMDKSQAMCPSFKATRDLRYSPKGRANMLRSWLMSKEIYNSRRNAKFAKTYEKDLKQSLDYCLNCQACKSQCPLSVDIADASEKFYQSYYQKHRRPFSDWLLRRMEEKANFFISKARLTNTLLSNNTSTQLLKKMGLVDLPQIKITDELENLTAELKSTDEIILENKSTQSNKTTVCLLFDQLTSPFDWQNLSAAKSILDSLDYQVFIVNDIASNKLLKLRGMGKQFEKKAKHSAQKLNSLNQQKIEVVFIDSAIGNCFNSEYHRLLDFKLTAISTIIERNIDRLKENIQPQMSNLKNENTQSYQLMLHCIEQSEMNEVGKSWKNIFAALGINLNLLSKGCCGMAGLFGHQVKTAELSKQIYQTNWQDEIKKADSNANQPILATGFSCRSQIKRIENKIVLHPLEILINKLSLE